MLFTFDYFIQFLYLKTNAIDLPKKKQLKITDYFICIFLLLLVVRLFYFLYCYLTV